MLHTKSIRSTLLLCVKTDGLVQSVFVNNRLLCVITHDARRCRWQDWKQGCGHALRRVCLVVLRWQGSLVAHCLSCWRQMESEKRNRCEISLLWGCLHQYQRDEFHFKEGNLGRISFSWSMVRSHFDFKKDFGWIVLSVMISGCVMTSKYILFGLTFKWLHFKLYNIEKIFLKNHLKTLFVLCTVLAVLLLILYQKLNEVVWLCCRFEFIQSLAVFVEDERFLWRKAGTVSQNWPPTV